MLTFIEFMQVANFAFLGPRSVNGFHRPPLSLVSKPFSSQLLNHNEDAIELQIGHRPINQRELNTQVTTMFTPFCP